MFHMFLLIVFLLVKIQSFKEDVKVELSIDYSEYVEEVPIVQPPLSQAEQAYLDRILAQAGNLSNRASNIAENLDKELSTENFVDDYLKQMNEERSEDWRSQQEEIKKRMLEPDYVPPVFDEKREIEMDDYSGPSNINYEFLEPPVNRFKAYLPVPVYKCQGEGTVVVSITVDQAGRVVSANPSLSRDYADKDCLLETARNYALNTRFEGNMAAPKFHKARIIYTFISQ